MRMTLQSAVLASARISDSSGGDRGRHHRRLNSERARTGAGRFLAIATGRVLLPRAELARLNGL